MTASTNLSYFLVASVTLKALDGAAAVTWTLSNRAVIGASGYVPIIKSIPGIGAKMAGYVPQTQVGSLVIDNVPGSLGYERRFSDLLERYTPIEQAVVIKVGPTVPTDTDPTGELVTVFSAKMLRWRIDPNNQTLIIDIESNNIERRRLTKAIDAATFPAAPAGSLGYNLPMVLGQDVEVKAIQCSADVGKNGTEVSYAYATTLSTEHAVGGVQTIWAKDSYGVFKQVQSAAAVGTACYSNTAAVASVETLPGLIDQNRLEIACWLNTTTANNWLISKIEIQGNGMSIGGLSVVGPLTCRIYEGTNGSASNPPGKMIGEATANGADYQTSFRGAADFWISFQFKTPVVLNSINGFWLSMEYDERGAGATGDPIELTTGGSFLAGATNWQRHDGADWRKDGTVSDDVWNFRAYGVVFTDSKSAAADINGLGYAKSVLTQSSTATDLTNLDLIFTVDGLCDDSGGSITGSASSCITSPVDALVALSQTWNGSAWVTPAFSKTNLTTAAVGAGSYTRTIAGATEGDVTLSELVASVCREHGLRVALLNAATPLSLFAWGTNISSSATLVDDDCKIIRVVSGDISTVINHAEIRYGKTLHGADFQISNANDGSQAYSLVLDWYDGANVEATMLCEDSADLFGPCALDNVEFNWIGDSTSAKSAAEFFLRKYQYPAVWVDFEVPLLRWRTLDLFSVCTLYNSELPAYFGTSSSGKRPTYSSSEVDILRGHYTRRAQPYRILIEARAVDFRNDYPVLSLGGFLLINPNDPT